MSAIGRRQTKNSMPSAEGYRKNWPEGLGFIPFRLSQRKGIKKSSLSDLGVLNDHAIAWEWAVSKRYQA